MNPRDPGIYKWIVVAVIWLIACLNYTDRMTIFTVLPVLKREMGLSDILLSLVGSTFLWAYALCSPLGGYLGDRLSRRKVILGSLIIFSVVTFATGLARTGAQLLSLRVLLGLSEALFLPPALAYVASFHSSATRSSANALVLTGLPAGAGLGAWFGGFMSDHYTWHAGFFVLGGVGVLAAVLTAVVLREQPAMAGHETAVEEGEPFFQKLAGILRVRTALALMFLAFALSLTSWPAHSWLPTYLYERFHLTLTAAGSVISLFAALPALLGSIGGGVLADWWSKRDVRGRMAVQVLGFAVMGPTMLAMGFLPTASAVAGNLLIYSVARGMLEGNSMPLFCSVVRPNRWAMAYGTYNLAGTLAGSLGILFIGMKKASWGIGYALSAMSLLLFLALLVMVLTMLRYLPRDLQAHAREEEREFKVLNGVDSAAPSF
ncbi:MAG: MFS transporter [Acidobacteria bacterium]|nr:MFS transporter [Acidobacteriota bacterium]